MVTADIAERRWGDIQVYLPYPKWIGGKSSDTSLRWSSGALVEPGPFYPPAIDIRILENPMRVEFTSSPFFGSAPFDKYDGPATSALAPTDECPADFDQQTNVINQLKFEPGSLLTTGAQWILGFSAYTYPP
jgi:hypothetical protein